MAPSFVVPPTPASGYAAPCRAQFTVQALGLHQHDTIALSLVSGPPGSSISTPISANPGSTIFTWQPPAQMLAQGQQTQQACFQARDRTGLTRTKCIQVTVSGGAGCAVKPSPPQQMAQQPQQTMQPQQPQQPQQQPPPQMAQQPHPQSISRQLPSPQPQVISKRGRTLAPGESRCCIAWVSDRCLCCDTRYSSDT